MTDEQRKQFIEEQIEIFPDDCEMGEFLRDMAKLQPCEDAISRQAAIDAIYACYIGGKEAVDKAPVNDLYAEGIDEAVNAIYELPPVSTEKTGRWIYKTMEGQFCSICDAQSVWKFNYCPNCGARMVEPQESEDKG